MGTEQDHLRNELKPCQIYQYDLYWIERKFHAFQLLFNIEISSEDTKYHATDVKELIKLCERIRVNQMDSLTFNGGNMYSVQFFKDMTVVHFNDIEPKSKALFLDICDHLEKKQRKFPFLKSKIFISERPYKTNFWKQTSIPNWITIIIQIVTLGIAVFAALN